MFLIMLNIMSTINNSLINLSIENEVWQRKKRTGTGSATTQVK